MLVAATRTVDLCVAAAVGQKLFVKDQGIHDECRRDSTLHDGGPPKSTGDVWISANQDSNG